MKTGLIVIAVCIAMGIFYLWATFRGFE